MEWVTTTLLLERLRDPGAPVWEQFVNRFRGPLVNFARQMGLTEDAAEDVAQNTMLTFVSRFQSGAYDREKGRLSSWLFGIAYMESLTARRKLNRQELQAPRQNGDHSFWAAVPDESDARRTWDEQWQRHIVQECLTTVRMEVAPATYRAFELLVLKNKQAADVATELGVSRNAVFIAKHRVLKRMSELRKELEDAPLRGDHQHTSSLNG